jgi:pimeloyl-ACP methyl ester carboxylesterase
MPCKPSIYNFYRFAGEAWGDVYGANPYGVVGLDGEPYFGWEKNADPTYDYVRIAAERLLERCRRLRREHGTRRFRFVGHSAGCFVANMATHHADFDIDQLLLCSPSVPRPDSIPNGWTREQIRQAMPNVARLASGKFFYFSMRPDTVLAYLRRDTHYATPLVREELPDVVAAARTPGPLRTADVLLGHWRTVHPRNWLSPPNLPGGTLLDWIDSQQ